MNMKTRTILSKALIHFFLLLGVFVTLFPFLWMILTSFKTDVECVQVPPTFLPQNWTFAGYERVWSRNILVAYKNTIIVAVSIVFFQLLTGFHGSLFAGPSEFPRQEADFRLDSVHDDGAAEYDADSEVQNRQCPWLQRQSAGRGDSQLYQYLRHVLHSAEFHELPGRIGRRGQDRRLLPAEDFHPGC